MIFVNSGAGLSAHAGWSAYAASKHGLKALADSLRHEEHAAGVRVTSVYPGRTASPMQAKVHQQEGKDYAVKNDALVFTRKLDKEGRLGFWRWTSIFLGLVGTYRKNDVVDVHWTVDGKTQVVTGLPFEP